MQEEVEILTGLGQAYLTLGDVSQATQVSGKRVVQFPIIYTGLVLLRLKLVGNDLAEKRSRVIQQPCFVQSVQNCCISSVLILPLCIFKETLQLLSLLVHCCQIFYGF